MRNLTDRWPQSGHFSPKLGHFSPIFEKEQERPPPPSSNYTPGHRSAWYKPMDVSQMGYHSIIDDTVYFQVLKMKSKVKITKNGNVSFVIHYLRISWFGFRSTETELVTWYLVQLYFLRRTYRMHVRHQK